MEKPNLKYLDDLAGSDAAFRQEIVAIIRAELQAERTAYLRALQVKNWQASAGSVHKLKHKIGIFGLEHGYRLAVRHEERLRAADASLAGDFEAILKELETFVHSSCL